MEDSTASTTHIVALVRELVTHLEVDENFLQEPLEALVANLGVAVSSFLGVQLIMVVDGHPVRLSLFATGEDDAADQPIATSLHVPLRVFAPADPDSTITFYAGTPGAFVDLAADLEYALSQPNPSSLQPDQRVSLDRHLTPISLVSGLFGLAELSVISTVVGVLIDRGHHPEEAPAELRRRARVDGVSPHAYAIGFLKRLSSRPPPEADPPDD